MRGADGSTLGGRAGRQQGGSSRRLGGFFPPAETFSAELVGATLRICETEQTWNEAGRPHGVLEGPASRDLADPVQRFAVGEGVHIHSGLQPAGCLEMGGPAVGLVEVEKELDHTCSAVTLTRERRIGADRARCCTPGQPRGARDSRPARPEQEPADAHRAVAPGRSVQRASCDAGPGEGGRVRGRAALAPDLDRFDLQGTHRSCRKVEPPLVAGDIGHVQKAVPDPGHAVRVAEGARVTAEVGETVGERPPDTGGVADCPVLDRQSGPQSGSELPIVLCFVPQEQVEEEPACAAVVEVRRDVGQRGHLTCHVRRRRDQCRVAEHLPGSQQSRASSGLADPESRGHVAGWARGIEQKHRRRGERLDVPGVAEPVDDLREREHGSGGAASTRDWWHNSHNRTKSEKAWPSIIATRSNSTYA